jgi:hypothetical protein
MDAEQCETDLASFIDYLEAAEARTEGGQSQAGGEVAYLAQCRLMDQIPRLNDDIDAAAVRRYFGDAPEYARNAWIGPGGTVSPLHFDPYHNIFVQVRVRGWGTSLDRAVGASSACTVVGIGRPASPRPRRVA